MLTSHAKRIFSDNGTCFGTNKSCSNRSHLQQCFIKALRFLLAWLLCFYLYGKYQAEGFFYKRRWIRNIPDCPGRLQFTTLPMECNLRVETCLLGLRSVWHPQLALYPFRAWCGDFQALGKCISTKTFAQSCNSGDFSKLEHSWTIDNVLPPAGAMTVTSIDVIHSHTFPKNLGHLDLKLVEGKR